MPTQRCLLLAITCTTIMSVDQQLTPVETFFHSVVENLQAHKPCAGKQC